MEIPCKDSPFLLQKSDFESLFTAAEDPTLQFLAQSLVGLIPFEEVSCSELINQCAGSDTIKEVQNGIALAVSKL